MLFNFILHSKSSTKAASLLFYKVTGLLFEPVLMVRRGMILGYYPYFSIKT